MQNCRAKSFWSGPRDEDVSVLLPFFSGYVRGNPEQNIYLVLLELSADAFAR